MQNISRNFFYIIFSSCIFLIFYMAMPVNANGNIKITKPKGTIKAGNSYKLKTTKSGSAQPVVWSVSNDKATINQKGRLKAKKAGKVKVIATSGGSKASITLRIKGKKKIGIDPGHQSKGNPALEPIGPGAKTKKAKVSSGTTGRYTKVPEYKLNLVVAKKLKKELLNRGYEVVMTRTKHDVDISNRERALLINESGADISVRIHANGSTSSSVHGACALYPSKSNPYVSHLSEQSKLLSSKILSSMCKETEAKNLGPIVDDNLTGTNWSKVPVTVIEMGFMSNEKEDRLMQTDAYQNKLAIGIAKGIDAYYESK